MSRNILENCTPAALSNSLSPTFKNKISATIKEKRFSFPQSFQVIFSSV
jgi:hypothetical protein